MEEAIYVQFCTIYKGCKLYSFQAVQVFVEDK
jgi:hypothetical protein